jgi:DNA-directed RNA polymerase II subunit RPB1
MNIHVPQSPETRAELKELMMVPLNIVSPQRSKPVIGIVQDTLLGCSLITRRDVFISKEFFMNICMCLNNWNGSLPVPAIIKPNQLWTGKQVINLILPKINLWNKSDNVINGDNIDFSYNDAYIHISDGELLSGILCKKTLGPTAGGVIHVTWIEYGPELTSLFITNVQMCVTYWLLQYGISIGIGDAVADAATMDKIKNVIAAQKNEVEKIVLCYKTREMEPEPGLNQVETFEKSINQVLNKAREDTGKVAQQSLRDTNNMKRMVIAGSKGNNNNISQVIACVAQQNVDGRRIRFGFQGRTLPHFKKGDYGPKAKGFIENSFLTGLEPQEFYFHAMGGREGLIDTAVKTADSGYIQRKLVKALEDLQVKYDGTVRNSIGEIIQFLYGEDGMDGTSLEAQKLDYIKMSLDELDDTYRIDFKNVDSSGEVWLNIDQTECAIDNTNLGKLDREYSIILDSLRDLREGTIQPEKADDSPILPVNLKRLIISAKKRFFIESNKTNKLTLNPFMVIDKIEISCEETIFFSYGQKVHK